MPHPWSLEGLAQSWVMTVRIDDQVAGYVWFTTIHDGVLEPHVCFHPDYHGKWFSLGVFRKLIMIFKYSGAKALVAQTISEEMEPVLKFMGFTHMPDGKIAILHREKVYRDGKGSQDPDQAGQPGS